MAISDSNYEGVFSIPSPKGIWQAAGDTNINTDYAWRAENIRTELGMLASANGTRGVMPAIEGGTQIGTLTRFYRRTRPDDPAVFVASSGGSVYTFTLGTQGWVKRGEGFSSDAWSHVTYETVRGGETVDILLMTNPQDGMIVVYGDDLSTERVDLSIGNYENDTNTYEDVKFAVIGRHAERIWGTGAPGYPDSIFYSRPYDPLDWRGMAAGEPAEQGGGRIDQPTWDGDSFISLTSVGNYLLAVKPRTAFEIRGTDPTSFSITTAYGTDGPVAARTICADRTNVFFLAEGQLGVYNGSTLQLLAKDALHETMTSLTPGFEDKATACVCGHVYYLALCTGGSEVPNTVVVYDTTRGTYMLRTGMAISDLYALGGTVYCTSADAPYEVLTYDDPQAIGYDGKTMKSFWQTPWLDLGKAYEKEDFVLRFTAEAQEDDYPLSITLETEKRERTKNILLSTQRKDYRVHMLGRGKRVRLTFGAYDRAGGFSITGGVQVEYSFDKE